MKVNEFLSFYGIQPSLKGSETVKQMVHKCTNVVPSLEWKMMTAQGRQSEPHPISSEFLLKVSRLSVRIAEMRLSPVIRWAPVARHTKYHVSEAFNFSNNAKNLDKFQVHKCLDLFGLIQHVVLFTQLPVLLLGPAQNKLKQIQTQQGASKKQIDHSPPSSKCPNLCPQDLTRPA